MLKYWGGGKLALVDGFLFSCFCVGGLAAATRPVVDQTPQKTGAHSVVMIEGLESGTWVELKSNRLVTTRPTTEPIRVRAGGRILWNRSRRLVDPGGLEHQFFEQRYQPGPRTFARGINIPRGGFTIMGTSLGYHRDAKGKLYGIGGSYFDTINRIQKPVYRRPTDALERASEKLAEQRSDLWSFAALDTETRENLIEGAELKLASLGKGSDFGLLWELQLPTTHGNFLNILLDAASGSVLNVDDGIATSECEPSTNNEVLMNGESQLPGISYQNLPATEAFDLSEPGFSYEAQCVNDDLQAIIVYLGEDSLQCTSPNRRYRVFPLKAEGYYDWAAGFHYNPVVPGRSAADAMHNTMLTMEAFGQLGWNSYDGLGSPAKIVVDSNCMGGRDNAMFSLNGSLDCIADGVCFCPLSEESIFSAQFSVALDVVAHEWGHGVIHHSAGIPIQQGHQWELHEGFADVIGYGVEFLMTGSTNWQDGDETGVVMRKVNVDVSGSSFHRCDQESYSNQIFLAEPHASGNKLPAAFRMMALGVGNPGVSGCSYHNYCSEDPTCPTNICIQSENAVPQAIGTDHAFRFLFDLLIYYAPSTLDWEDLPAYATLTGKNQNPHSKVMVDEIAIHFANSPTFCVPYTDYEGMKSAHKAFLGIGYPAATPIEPCQE